MMTKAHSPLLQPDPPAHPDRVDTAAPASTGSPALAGKGTRRRTDRKRTTLVNWYAAALIVMTLLLASGWELWRWILLIVTLD